MVKSVLWALPTSAVLQVVLFAGIFVLNFFMVTDPDLWWHLAAGRHMVATGAIPTSDPFSYTAAGQPWIAHEWLAEIVMYLLYRSGGYLVPLLFFASLITLTFWTVFRTLRVLGRSPVASSCITFWVAAMSLAGWNVRPQVFSYLFFALYLFLLLRSRVRVDRWLWLLPVVMIAWVNLHAGYVMGLLLLGLFIFGEWINRLRAGAASKKQKAQGATPERWDGETWGRGELGTQTPGPSTWDPAPGTQDPEPESAVAGRASSLRGYLAVAAATLAATAVNPQGLSMLLYPLTYAGTQNASMKYIAEWQSPNFHDYFFFVFGASMMVLMVAPSRRPTDWALGVLLLAMTFMSLQSARVIPFYALASAPFLGLRLAGESPVVRRSRRGTPWNWLVLALCLAALASTLLLSDRTQLGPEPRAKDYPVAGVQYLREAGLNGNLFNTYHWGGFLVWEFYPERRVFIDGRADMYGDQFVESYKKVYNVRSGWQEVLEQHQVEVALVEKDAGVANLLAASQDWEEVFLGEVERIFVRAKRNQSAQDGERSTR